MHSNECISDTHLRWCSPAAQQLSKIKQKQMFYFFNILIDSVTHSNNNK